MILLNGKDRLRDLTAPSKTLESESDLNTSSIDMALYHGSIVCWLPSFTRARISQPFNGWLGLFQWVEKGLGLCSQWYGSNFYGFIWSRTWLAMRIWGESNGLNSKKVCRWSNHTKISGKICFVLQQINIERGKAKCWRVSTQIGISVVEA